MPKVFEYTEPTNPEEVAQFYRKLERHLHPVNTLTGDWSNLKTVGILGDSYMIEDRVTSEVGKNPSWHIPMLPHATNGRFPEWGAIYRSVRVENLSMGGATMRMMLSDKSIMGKWIKDVPTLTIVH